MRDYRGPKPCPGCARPGNEKQRGAVDELCSDCKTLIKLGQGVIAEKPNQYSSITIEPYLFGPLEYNIQGKTKDYRSNKNFKTEHPVYISDQNHSKKDNNNPGSSKDLNEKFQALLKTIDQGKKASDNVKHHIRGEGCFFGRDTVYLHNDTALAVFDLVDSMARWSQRIQKQAYTEGKNLLVGLASGDMTLKEFNVTSARYDDE